MLQQRASPGGLFDKANAPQNNTLFLEPKWLTCVLVCSYLFCIRGDENYVQGMKPLPAPIFTLKSLIKNK